MPPPTLLCILTDPTTASVPQSHSSNRSVSPNATLSPCRLHIGELEARNRAMISELDTARMELDNKIREKRELMQAHAAYVEEMERQHA